jgi:hypothetical protein
MFHYGTRSAVLEAEADEALTVPTREELLGPEAEDSDDWLSVESLPTPVVPFDSTLSMTGVTEFFRGEQPDEGRAAAAVPIVSITSIADVSAPRPIDDVSPARKFIDQFDRFASDFHAFAADCQASIHP